MPDYGNLLDAEIRAFIDRTGSFYPADTAERSVAEQRRIYDAMCEAFREGYPEGVKARNGIVPLPGHRVPVRRYRTEDADMAPAEVVYCHGGGFVVGGLESHDEICADICAATGFPVTAVDYRLSPEAKHPAAFTDARGVFMHAAASGRRVILVGDSAGGNLAAAVSLAVRGGPLQPGGQVLIYPGLGGEMEGGSYAEHAEAPMLTAADLRFYRGIRTGGKWVRGDPTLAPLEAESFAGVAPTVAFAAECDPLADDAGAFASRVRAAGGRAASFVQKGLVHGWLRARRTTERGREAFDRILDAIDALGRGGWPYD